MWALLWLCPGFALSLLFLILSLPTSVCLFLPFSVYSSFSFSLPLSVHFARLSYSPPLFLHLLVSIFFPSVSVSVSVHPLPLLLSFSDTYLSLCLFISVFHLFHFTLGPTVFFSLSRIFPFLCLCLSAPAFLSEPHLTEALLYLPVCLTQLSSKKPPMSSIFLQSQAVTSVAADTGELDLTKIILVLKKLEETLGPATSLQKGGSDISVSFRPQLEPLYGSEPDIFRNESLTLKKPCLCVQLHHGHPLYRSGHHSSLLKLTSVLTSPLFQKTMMPVLEGTERSSVLLESAVKHDYLSGEWEEKSKDKTGEVTWGQAR